MYKNNYPFIFLLLLVVFLSSCNKQSQLLYVNGVGNEKISTITPPSYFLKPGDVLYVQILTQDPKISTLFNNQSSGTSSSQMYSEVSQYLYGYSVNDSGTIRLPVFGYLKVAGLNMNQTKDLIQKETDKYLNDGIAIVKLLSFKITVLGEVKSPGIHSNFKDNLTIFEGLGLAGDLTDYAERSKVLLVRQTPEGVKTNRVNLQDKNIIFSDNYYLLPNDVLFVEPRKGKLFNMNSPNISLFLSIVSTTLLLINFLAK